MDEHEIARECEEAIRELEALAWERQLAALELEPDEYLDLCAELYTAANNEED